MTQIKDEFTLETLRKVLEAVTVNRPPERNLVIYTGLDGIEELNYSFEMSNAKEQVIFLKEKNVITEDEARSLIDMVSSKDRENFELAKMIIAQKSVPFLNLNINSCQSNLNQPITVIKAPIL